MKNDVNKLSKETVGWKSKACAEERVEQCACKNENIETDREKKKNKQDCVKIMCERRYERKNGE